MRLICPHCMNGVTVPDEAAGTEVPCPNCGKAFPTPARYNAAVAEASSAVAGAMAGAPPSAPYDPQVRGSGPRIDGGAAVPPTPPTPPTPTPAPVAPAPPPGFVPPAPPSAPSAPAAHPAPAVAGYAHSCGITFAPKVVAWLPAVLLTFVLVFSTFPWVGSYVGSSAVYAQRPWGAMFGGKPTRNFELERAGIIPSGWIDKMRSDWKLLIPFFLFLFVGLAFAWAERGFRSVDPRQIPPLAKLWPWRNAVVVGCAGFALLFFLLQLANGFSMERAIQQQIAEKYADQRAAAGESAAALETVRYLEEQELRRYNVEWTSWLYLALLCNIGALGAVVLRALLERRGDRPPPRLVLHY